MQLRRCSLPGYFYPAPLEGFWGRASHRLGNASCLWLLPLLLELWRVCMSMSLEAALLVEDLISCAECPGSGLVLDCCCQELVSRGQWCMLLCSGQCDRPLLLCVPWGPLEGPPGGGHCVCHVGPSWQGQCWCGGSRSCWIPCVKGEEYPERELPPGHQTASLRSPWVSSLALVLQGRQ